MTNDVFNVCYINKITMNTYIALLRGINVSGHKMIKMEDLKRVLAETGFTGLKTYIQSGNIIFRSGQADPARLCAEIAAKILEHFGFEVPVVIRTREELESVSKNNPFLPGKPDESAKLHVTFLSDVAANDLENRIMEVSFLPDEFVIKGKEVYLYCPNGYGNTKLTNQLFESRLKVTATTRNWKTVERLVKMTSDE